MSSLQALLLDRLLSPAAHQGAGPVAHLLRQQGLRCVYQPLADLRSGHIYAHEALVRGPEGTALHTPDALLAQARAEGLLHDFEIACVVQALQGWTALQAPGRLFINISADALVHTMRLCPPGTLGAVLRRYGLQPRMLVLELTEHDRVSDLQQLDVALREVHAAGARVALDDFGDGRSSLRLWSEVKPDYVKIDKYFIHAIADHPARLQMVQAIKGIADVFGTALVAEGIETREDLHALRDLDIPYGQGWLIGRPAAAPRSRIEGAAHDVLQDRRVAVLPHLGQAARPGILRSLLRLHAPTVTPHTPNEAVAALFRQQADLHAVAVVEGARPVGLINRLQFMTHYATPYFREVHGRKPCLQQANTAPRVVEIDCDVDQLVGILTSQDQRYLRDGYIVTENGRYVGLGTGDELVRAVTETRIEAARHANPLTFLPGNIPISLHLQRLLDSGTPFAACYADLNHFKPFNDTYGYWQGDEMIRCAARIATAHCDPRRDFVGHVGGDDFMLLFQSPNWQQRCEHIAAQFALEAAQLHDEEARSQGGILAEDRHGVQRFFPLVTLSIGAVPVAPGRFARAEEVAHVAAAAKRRAKAAASPVVVCLPDDGAWPAAQVRVA
ncbi:phosphodiesterase [Acidovorax lacteus]|uniref:EAL domain-containing protein n=1 Tax=Acidovorax lacteus TaxID=1924988 RepID=A0ABP8LJ01_9BURK